MFTGAYWFRLAGLVTIALFTCCAVLLWTGLGEALARDPGDPGGSSSGEDGGVPAIVFIVAAGFAGFAIYQGILDHYKKKHQQEEQETIIIPLNEETEDTTPEEIEQKATAHNR